MLKASQYCYLKENGTEIGKNVKEFMLFVYVILFGTLNTTFELN
jgi:hypothetical protein